MWGQRPRDPESMLLDSIDSAALARLMERLPGRSRPDEDAEVHFTQVPAPINSVLAHVASWGGALKFNGASSVSDIALTMIQVGVGVTNR